MQQTNKNPNAWAWIPSLYYIQGLPYVVVMAVSVVLYKRLGVSNTDIALYTSWLYLPWVIKPLWSPFIDMFRTKRFWVWAMQFLMGICFAGVALSLPTSDFLRYSLVFFYLVAFSSASHDIAADGFYMMALDDSRQSFFVGIRSTFYRFASITGQGLIVILAGTLETNNYFPMNTPNAWAITFLIIAGLLGLASVYHYFMLPKPEKDTQKLENTDINTVLSEFFKVFVLFFRKKDWYLMIAFLLLYRLGESQLVKLASPFLLDGLEKGGLGLSTEQVGFVYGTIGVIALTLGGILGGIAISARGLKFWLFYMLLAINVPNLVYVYMSFAQPESFWLISSCVAIEQFGYGFGFTAYMLYMIYISQGEHATAHYAIGTGFMALGMMLPGMASGWIQEQIGYQNFFIWVVIATIPSFVIGKMVQIEENFGKKK